MSKLHVTLHMNLSTTWDCIMTHYNT